MHVYAPRLSPVRGHCRRHSRRTSADDKPKKKKKSTSTSSNVEIPMPWHLGAKTQEELDAIDALPLETYVVGDDL